MITLLQLDVPFVATSPTWVTVDDAAAVVGRGHRAGVRRRHRREALDGHGPGQVIDGRRRVD